MKKAYIKKLTNQVSKLRDTLAIINEQKEAQNLQEQIDEYKIIRNILMDIREDIDKLS